MSPDEKAAYRLLIGRYHEDWLRLYALPDGTNLDEDTLEPLDHDEVRSRIMQWNVDHGREP